MNIVITPDFVKKAASVKHPNSLKWEALANRLKIHADGGTPKELIDVRRPNESETTKEYRQKIYRPVTEEPITKVINSLSKIRRSQDWSINYDSDAVPAAVAKGESLQDYCEFNYPGYSSITNWAFSELLKRSLIDANSVCAVVIKSLPTSNSEYAKPEIEMFSSEQICAFVPGQYYVLKSEDVVMPDSLDNNTVKGNIYYVITDTQIARYQNVGNVFSEVFVYNHNFGILPAFKVGGVFSERCNNDTIQKSRIASMVPYLDEAAREYSDLQAEMVQHVFSEKIIYTNTECSHCKGIGFNRKKKADGGYDDTICPHCHGGGYGACAAGGRGEGFRELARAPQSRHHLRGRAGIRRAVHRAGHGPREDG
jgi:hypothetical protein